MKDPQVRATHVTITSKCKTAPRKVALGPGDQVDFRCAARKAFGLLLPGMIFEGYNHNFVLVVNGPDFVPNPPLQVRKDAKHGFKNYIYDQTGLNCHLKAPPPEVPIPRQDSKREDSIPVQDSAPEVTITRQDPPPEAPIPKE